MLKNTVEKHLNKILDYIDVDTDTVIIENDGACIVTIQGENLNFLIGYRGESLAALENILGQAVYKELNEWYPISVDINGYKKSRLEKLEDIVKGFIDRVRFHQKEVALPPLTASERRHIHTFVAEYMDIKSESRGEGTERRLYLIPNN